MTCKVIVLVLVHGYHSVERAREDTTQDEKILDIDNNRLTKDGQLSPRYVEKYIQRTVTVDQKYAGKSIKRHGLIYSLSH